MLEIKNTHPDRPVIIESGDDRVPGILSPGSTVTVTTARIITIRLGEAL